MMFKSHKAFRFTLATIIVTILLTDNASAKVEGGGNFPKPSSKVDVLQDVRMDLRQTQWQIQGVGLDKYRTVDSAGSGKGVADGNGVIVAVLSDGLDDLHPDLAGVVLPGWDVTSGKAFKPGRAHSFGASGENGTLQATVIAGSDNGEGIRGIAPGSRILPVVVDNAENLSDRKVAEGVKWAVQNGAKLITLSLGVSEVLTTETAKLTCEAISEARALGALTFVASANDTGFSEPVFTPSLCADAVVVTAVDEQLTYRPKARVRKIPTFSAPGFGVVGGISGGSVLPYSVSTSGVAAPAVAAGAAAAVWSAQSTLSAEELLELLSSSSTSLGDESIYGAGLLDVSAALGKISPRTAKERREVIAARSVPVIVDASRDGLGYTALSWEPPFNAVVKDYRILLYSRSVGDGTWSVSESTVDGSSVRTVLEAELNDDSYVVVVADVDGGERRSLPVNYTRYNPVDPVHALDVEEAAVTGASVRWVPEGLEVSVETNDPTRNWKVFVIDPVTNEPVKNVEVRAGLTRTLIKLGSRDKLRNTALLVAAGMGRNGVDTFVLPQFGLSATVLSVGAARAGVFGKVNCVTDQVFGCGSRALPEGTKVEVIDARSGKLLTSAVIRSDGTYSAVWKHTSNFYDVVVQAAGERSMRHTNRFLVR
jgi:hypothetical protein